MKEANNIQKIMNDKNLTYRQLARLTGISIGHLQKIANGSTSPTQRTMIAIAKGLQLPVVDVFDLSY